MVSLSQLFGLSVCRELQETFALQHQDPPGGLPTDSEERIKALRKYAIGPMEDAEISYKLKPKNPSAGRTYSSPILKR